MNTFFTLLKLHPLQSETDSSTYSRGLSEELTGSLSVQTPRASIESAQQNSRSPTQTNGTIKTLDIMTSEKGEGSYPAITKTPIRHPVPVKSNNWSTGKLKQKDLSLLDISSPPAIIKGSEKPSMTNKTSHSNNLADLNQITTDVNQKPPHQLLKRISNSLSGPSVSSLYYSPYSSFAPSYDTTGTVQTADQACLKYLSSRRLDDWCKRGGIYDLIDDLEDILILPENNQVEKKDNKPMEAEVVNRSWRKRQRTRSKAFKVNTEKTHKSNYHLDPSSIQSPDLTSHTLRSPISSSSNNNHQSNLLSLTSQRNLKAPDHTNNTSNQRKHSSSPSLLRDGSNRVEISWLHWL
ncbi:hypothetical protein BY996DRAFT_6476065 [Phakopsora pachyrhizi]|nr:hypothetical protein BY996DRAFT_6476065 [Phakopsora pachyrhizi]